MTPTGSGSWGSRPGARGSTWASQDRIDLYFGTFAKAFAAIGGVTAADRDVVEWVRYNARTNVFAKALPLVYVKTVEQALSIVENTPQLRERMWHITRLAPVGPHGAGIRHRGHESPPSRRST